MDLSLAATAVAAAAAAQPFRRRRQHSHSAVGVPAAAAAGPENGAATHLRHIAAAAAAVPALLFGHKVPQPHELFFLTRAEQLCEAAALAPGTAEPRVQLVVHLTAGADAQWGPGGEA